jgi:two-component system sensor histidine kinase PhoQ
MSYSLQARAMLIGSAVLAVFLIGTGIVLDRGFRDSAEAAMRDGLEAYAETMRAGIENQHLDGLAALPQTLTEKLSEPHSGLYARLVRRTDGREVWSSNSARALSIPWPVPENFWTARLDPVEPPNGPALYVLSVDIRYQKPRSRAVIPYLLQLAETLDDKESYYYARMNKVRHRLWRWFGGAALVLLILQGVILRRSFAPLRRVAADLRRIEAGGADRLHGNYPRELEGLTENLNALLDQAAAHLSRYRDALGDLAHSLKTPLAVLRVTLDAAAAQPLAKELTQQQIDALNHIIEYQLKRAAASGRTHLAQPIAVGEKARQVILALQKVYADKSVECRIGIEPSLVFRGDEGDLLEILGNLADNAFKWARSRVAVRAVSDDEQGLELMVEDDGPGIDPELASRLPQRWQRADPSAPGHGLGLAIVASIASAYGGVLTIDMSPLGGARVSATGLR